MESALRRLSVLAISAILLSQPAGCIARSPTRLAEADLLVIEKQQSDLVVALEFIGSTPKGSTVAANPFLRGFSSEQVDSLDLLKEETLARYCGVDVEEGLGLGATAVAVAAATWAVGKVAEYLLDRAEEKLAQTLREHVAQYSNPGARHAFYDAVENGLPTLSARCIRFTKARKSAETKPSIELDLVAQVHVDTDALTLRPLRLYVSRTQARSAKRAGENARPVNLAFSLQADATWLEGQTGRRSTVLSDVIFSERVYINGTKSVTQVGGVKGHTKYYIDDEGWEAAKNNSAALVGPDWRKFESTLRDWPLSPRLPLIPWSHTADDKGKLGKATIVLTVTEAGLTPVVAKALHDLLKENKAAMAKFLKETIKDELASVEQ